MLFLFRIGSRPVLISVLFTLALSFSSCSDISERELVLLTAIEESLINSNMTINRSTESLFALINESLADPTTAYKAQRWQPKALEVRKLTAEMYNYLEKIKSELKKDAVIISDNDNTKFNEKGSYAVKQKFITQDKGKELFVNLSKYKNDILSIDPDSKEVFKDFLLVATRIDSLDITKQNVNGILFENASVIASLVALSHFQNNLKNIENRMVQFCAHKIPSTCGFLFDVYSPIVAQNSSFLRGGQVMEITAGVGAFSKAAKPVIVFNGKTLPLNESGVAVYKFKAPSKPGKYAVPVKITFIDEEGREQTITKDAEYTVAVDPGKD